MGQTWRYIGVHRHRERSSLRLRASPVVIAYCIFEAREPLACVVATKKFSNSPNSGEGEKPEAHESSKSTLADEATGRKLESGVESPKEFHGPF